MEGKGCRLDPEVLANLGVRDDDERSRREYVDRRTNEVVAWVGHEMLERGGEEAERLALRHLLFGSVLPGRGEG